MNSDLVFYYMFHDTDYFNKVFTSLTDNDFTTIEDKAIMKGFQTIQDKYKKVASIEELMLFTKATGLRPELAKAMSEKLVRISQMQSPNVNRDLLVEATEKYVKNIRLEQLLERGITMIEGKNKADTHDTLLEYLKSDIVGLSFQSSLGHDYFKDASKRFEEYGKLDSRLVSSGIGLMDAAGAGKPKSLTVLLATSNVGKCWSKSTKFKVYSDANTINNLKLFLKEKYEHR